VVRQNILNLSEKCRLFVVVDQDNVTSACHSGLLIAHYFQIDTGKICAIIRHDQFENWLL
jgi:hypothetical protein